MQSLRYSFNIPISLCLFVAKEKGMIAPFRLYMYLKACCSGQLRLSPNKRREVAKALQISPRSIETHLNALRKRNWVGYNPRSGYSFIRGFHKVMQLEGLGGRRAVGFITEEDLLPSKQKFHDFVYGSIIGYFAQTQIWKERSRVKSEYLKGCSNHHLSRNSLPNFVPEVACNALVELLGVSKGSAHKFKKQAHQSGYIQLRGNLEFLPIPLSEASHYEKSHPQFTGRVKKRKGQVYLQVPDKVLPLLEYPKKGKRKARLYQ